MEYILAPQKKNSMYEESGYCLKSYTLFLRPGHTQLQRLPGRTHRGKLSTPRQTWGTASALQPLREGELMSRTQAPLAGHTLSHICGPSLRAFNLRLPYLRPSQRSSSSASA